MKINYLDKNLKTPSPADTVRNQPASSKAASLKPQATQPTAQTPPALAPKPVMPTANPVSAMIAAAGLPSDKLSTSVVSFARFFSLPFKPELMAAIRKQALAQPAPQSAPADSSQLLPVPLRQAGLAAAVQTLEKEAAGFREAVSLAAAAAESKGVKLNSDGLEAFASAIDPERRGRQNSGKKGQRHGGNEKENPSSEDIFADTPVSGSALRDSVLEASEKNPMLAMLNRLPGKNGCTWIVLPFNYNAGGNKLRVSMRVLVENDTPGTSRFRRAVLDITENNGGNRRLFSMEPAADKTPKLTVFVNDKPGQKACEDYIRELSGKTGIPANRIAVQNREGEFPCESGGGNDLLLSINESV